MRATPKLPALPRLEGMPLLMRATPKLPAVNLAGLRRRLAKAEAILEGQNPASSQSRQEEPKQEVPKQDMWTPTEPDEEQEQEQNPASSHSRQEEPKQEVPTPTSPAPDKVLRIEAGTSFHDDAILLERVMKKLRERGTVVRCHVDDFGTFWALMATEAQAIRLQKKMDNRPVCGAYKLQVETTNPTKWVSSAANPCFMPYVAAEQRPLKRNDAWHERLRKRHKGSHR